jgi:hypothetical protein
MTLGAGGEFLQPMGLSLPASKAKSEIRSTKFETNPNDQNSKFETREIQAPIYLEGFPTSKDVSVI